MCLFKKRKRSEDDSDLASWLNATGPSDADYEKTSLDYQMRNSINKEKQSSFDDDSSMTP